MITILDPALLNYNSYAQRYETSLSFDGHAVKIIAYYSQEGIKDEVNRALSEKVLRVLNLNEAVLTFCSAQLLATKNESWLEDEQAPFNEAQFKRAFHLYQIEYYLNEEITLFYQVGDLFWGHSVVVGLNSDYTFKYATLEG